MASVIKAGKIIPGGTAIGLSEFNLQDMSHHASTYLDRVKQQAAQIIQDARRQSLQVQAQIERETRQTALAEAHAVVREETREQLATLLPALQHAADALEQHKNAWIRQWEQNLVRLAVAVAQRVVRRELTRQPDISRQWIREALELAAGSPHVTLHLHPADWEALGCEREEFVAQFGRLAPTDIVADPTISQGGCRVVTQHGYIDQQLETQLARMEAELTD
jgi:flagellar assembly protein FliH